MVTGTRLVLKWVKPLTVFDLPFSSGPTMSPVHTLRPVVRRFEVAVPIARKQCHADWHDGWMPHVRPTLPGGTWNDNAFVKETSCKSIE